MELKIDESMLEKVISEKIGTAIQQALGDYAVTRALGEKFSESIAYGAIAEAVDAAVKNLDTERLTKSLAEQIERTATAATVSILRSSFVEVIAKLRGVSEYGSDRLTRLAEIKAELQF